MLIWQSTNMRFFAVVEKIGFEIFGTVHMEIVERDMGPWSERLTSFDVRAVIGWDQSIKWLW